MTSATPSPSQYQIHAASLPLVWVWRVANLPPPWVLTSFVNGTLVTSGRFAKQPWQRRFWYRRRRRRLMVRWWWQWGLLLSQGNGSCYLASKQHSVFHDMLTSLKYWKMDEQRMHRENLQMAIITPSIKAVIARARVIVAIKCTAASTGRARSVFGGRKFSNSHAM